MLNRVVRIGMTAIFIAVALFSFGSASKAFAGTSASVVESVVREADISDVIDLIQRALVEYDGLSLDDHNVIYSAIGRTNAAIDHLYDTGATGDLFNTAEDLLLTQLDLLHEVEAATLSEDIDDLNTVVPMLIDLAQRRLAFERQMGNAFIPLAAKHDVSVVDIARDDAATRTAMAKVITALATGRPVDLDISEVVYQALGETSRGLDLVDETFETGDVFNAAVDLLEERFQFLVDLENAVISGDLDDLRVVGEEWVRLSQRQLIFERQLAARDSNRLSRSFLNDRGSRFFSRTTRRSRVEVPTATVETHASQVTKFVPQVHTVQPGDTLASIAEQYGTTVDEIAKLNDIRNPNLISTGLRLLVPAAAAAAQ